MLSNNPDFKELLLLHGRDRRLVKLLHELEALPEDIEKLIQEYLQKKFHRDCCFRMETT